MNAFPVPFRFIAAALVSCLLAGVGILNLRDRVIWSEPTDGVFWEESEEGLRAVEVEQEGPGRRAGVRAGDRLISIDGRATATIGDYSDAMYGTKPGATVEYRLRGEGGVRSAIVQIGTRTLLSAGDGLHTMLALLYLGIGIFVLFRGERASSKFHLYSICLSAFVVHLFSYTSRLGALDWLVYALDVLAFLLLPALFVHFCLRFPVDVISGKRGTLLLYAPVVAFVVLRTLWMTGHLAALGLPRTAHASGIIDRLELIYFSAGCLVAAALLLKRRLESREFVVRQQLKWVGYGTVAGVGPFTLIYVIPVLAGVRSNFAMDASILFLAIVPLSTAYALIHYRLRDVEAIARRSAAYFISSSCLLAIYLLFVLGLGRTLQWAAPQAGFVGVCVAVLAIALLFAPLRNAVQMRLDKLFYKEQFENRSTLLDFARTLNAEISLSKLAQSIAERISRTFLVEQVVLFLGDQLNDQVFHAAHVIGGSVEARPYRREELVSDQSSGLEGVQRGGDYLDRTTGSLAESGFRYVQVLRYRGRTIGAIALGRLPDGRHFSSEDLELMAGLSRYAAIALENAALYCSVEAKAQELQRLQTYTENILESINVAVLALDSRGRIESCNRAFEELYGRTRGEIGGSLVETVLPQDIIASIRGVAGAIDWEVRRPADLFKLYMENAVGRRLIVNLSLIPLQDSASGGSLIVLEDVTEKVQLEDQLLQAEKLSSIGLLAAGIAHEVNTPIAGISSYTQMLLKDTPASDQRKHILEKIEKQTFRAAEIVNGLLNFSRMNGSEFKEVNINNLIHDSLNLLEHQLQSCNIKVESQYDSSLPPVHGNQGKLQQVFINLFLNARDAMPKGGALTVQTAMNESMVIVDVADTGLGISEENIKKIFDPFFSTKAVGKGTGLGLAVTYGIIQEHGGRILVDSDNGKGAHFRVKLPTRLN